MQAVGLSGFLWPLVQIAGTAWQLTEDRPCRRQFWTTVFHQGFPAGVDERYQIGKELLSAGAPTEAATCFLAVRADRPDDPAVLSAIASARRSAGDLEGAWAAIEQAHTMAPSSGSILLTAAQILHCQGAIPEALTWLSRALEARPNHSPTFLQRGLTHLLGGNIREGWRDFEHRPRPLGVPEIADWRGGPLSGTVVVLGEQGIGDLFHFLRFIPLLHDRGANRVVVQSPPSVRRLLEINGFETTPPGLLHQADWSVPLLSLPHRLGLGVESLRPAETYLIADEALPSYRHQSTDPIRLGVAWRGSPDFGETFLRDFDPALIPALTDVPNVHWTSLQYGEDLPAGVYPRDFQTLTGDWLESARRLQQLDGVITVDTSMAHLAGAMGRPVAILLPYSPDWRWGLAVTCTNWYPSARLIRQSRPGDWGDTIPNVHAWIHELATARLQTAPPLSVP